ncbi:MAG: hypothetical protein SFY81_00330 [Verrucomicrobiota bacterium]|nr:hypothetical protein [Verrucomicrobiota bacterium]
MKAVRYFALLSFLLVASASAQEKQKGFDAESSRPTPVEQRKGRKASQLGPVRDLERPYQMSGFFFDLMATEKPAGQFSLRQPVNKKRPQENMVTEIRSERPKGFRLFAIDF